MRVVIAGATGLIGTALSASLRDDGHEPIALVRREAKGPSESQWDPQKGLIDHDLLARADVAVNLAGASIGGKRLTDSYAQVVLQSRLDSTATLTSGLVEVGFSGVLIQGSAMGFYGDRGESPLTEHSGPGDTLLAGIVTQWEAAARPAVEAGIRTVYIRTGLVLAADGGFAERLFPLTRLGLLRAIGPGTAWHSWIALEDHVAATKALIASDHAGPANVISPSPVRNRDLIRELSAVAGRTPGLPVPAWAARLGVGPAIEDLLSSQLASPTVLTDLGFEWTYPTIADAAEHVMTQAGHAAPPSDRPST